MYLYHPQLRSFMFRLVVWISVADMGAAISIFFGNPQDGTGACYAQAFLQQFFQTASMFWTLAVAVTVQSIWKKKRTIEEAEAAMWKVHALVWGGKQYHVTAISCKYGTISHMCRASDVGHVLHLSSK
mmetsp:Transcript_27504/g.38221  ORF Transcript_27504/g.38221 Transcript_27504/m.38221 type:complete len:128 (+) Transcript_27504:348-731(+)